MRPQRDAPLRSPDQIEEIAEYRLSPVAHPAGAFQRQPFHLVRPVSQIGGEQFFAVGRQRQLEHFRSGLSNASVEAMNAQIQAAKARAKGYATHDNLITIAYLLCARLRHLPRNPWLTPTAA